MPSPANTEPSWARVQYKQIVALVSRQKKRLTFWVLFVLVIATVSAVTLGDQRGAFWASIAGIPFNGTVYPIQQVPRFGMLASLNIDGKDYRQIPSAAFRSFDGPGDENISTGYNSGYYSTRGSHEGIDIRAPEFTPVLAIANGLVHKVQLSGGLGKAVTIEHPNVPDPNDPQKTTTLYSVYGHLSTIAVSEGQLVNKGEGIGTVGNTGFATGYHLHFAINLADAPFVPYFPFTGTEQRAAGYSFVQAVDNCLGCDRLTQFTTDPLAYAGLYRQFETPDVPSPPPPASLTQQSSQPDSVTTGTAEESQPTGTSEPAPAQNKTTAERVAERIQRAQERARILLEQQQQAAIKQQVSVGQPEPMKSIVSLNPLPSPATTASSARPQVTENIPEPSVSLTTQTVATIEIAHDGNFRCGIANLLCRREKVDIILYDANGTLVRNPEKFDLFIRTIFGQASINQTKLTEKDFSGTGKVSLYVTPTSPKNVILEAILLRQSEQLKQASKPLLFDRSNI